MINLCFHGLGGPGGTRTSRPPTRFFYDPNLKDYDYDLKICGASLEAAGYHLVSRASGSIRTVIRSSST